MELAKDYDIEIMYHPGKINVVVDTLSRKTAHSSTLTTGQKKLQEKMIGASIKVLIKGLTAKLTQLTVQPTLRRHVCDTQEKNPYLNKVL